MLCKNDCGCQESVRYVLSAEMIVTVKNSLVECNKDCGCQDSVAESKNDGSGHTHFSKLTTTPDC